MNLREQFGGIDIYLFDQLLKGRFDASMRVLDAGCRPGRNLVYFLRAGFDVCGIDLSPDAVARVCALARTLAPTCRKRISDWIRSSGCPSRAGTSTQC